MDMVSESLVMSPQRVFDFFVKVDLESKKASKPSYQRVHQAGSCICLKTRDVCESENGGATWRYHYK